MTKINNPFIVSGYIPNEYFCDREIETNHIIKLLINGNNIVLISPRRMGKTALIEHCYHQEPIANEFTTFFFDILHTTSLRELTFALGKKIYDTLLPKSKKKLQQFLHAIKSLQGSFGFDLATNMPTFNISLGDIKHPELTLDEIFKYLESSENPCILAIDEFQQIAKYPEKNIEVLLRSYIQRMANCKFIFAGSERHNMQQMFTNSARPFYNSAEIMELKAIPCEIFSQFITDNFRKFSKSISSENASAIYRLFNGNTYGVQRLCNVSFADTPIHKECTAEIISDALEQVLDANDVMYREMLSNLTEQQKELIYAIAKDNIANNITSGDFIKAHNLRSASSVQYAAKKLAERDIIASTGKQYFITDKIMEIWLRRLIGAESGKIDIVF